MPAKTQFDPVAENKRWMLYIVFAIVVSWVGFWGVLQLEITDTTTVLFFVLLFTAITATMMPPVAYLNARFGRVQEPRVYRYRFVRQSIWVGACATVAAWLQMRRALNLLLAFILIAVFVLIETFLITRETPQDL